MVAVVSAPVGAQSLTPEAVAPGVFVLAGADADASAENQGRVINSGFLIGEQGVIVIDSGANHRHGEAILAAIERTTAKPVRLLINTHPNPSFVLGNTAFARRGVPILSTAATAAAMAERCPRCIASLTESIGRAAMEGTQIVLPQQTITQSTTVTIAGRRLALLAVDHARTEGDLAVLDLASGTLFSGDLVYRSRISHFAEANFSGWIGALQHLARQPIRILVPGRGAVGDATAITAMTRYLDQLRQRVSKAYQSGLTLDETLTRVELPEFADWRGYARNHLLNAQRAWFEIEREDFERVEPQ